MKNVTYKKRRFRSFANTLREVRRSLGLTQEEMSRRLGVSRAVLSLYETGKSNPSIKVLDRLYRETNISFDALMGYSRNLSAAEPDDRDEMNENTAENALTLDEYQYMAARTINPDLDQYRTLLHAVHEIAAECGEIHALFQKTYQGHAMDLTELQLEVGDLLWGIAEICTAMRWELSAVARANIDKLLKRYPDGFSSDRSVNREEEHGD